MRARRAEYQASKSGERRRLCPALSTLHSGCLNDNPFLPFASTTDVFNMRIPQSSIQKIKTVVHIAQAALIFIGGCLALAVLTKDGKTGGQVGYYFALVSIQRFDRVALV